jgi:hypothetical protein
VLASRRLLRSDRITFTASCRSDVLAGSILGEAHWANIIAGGTGVNDGLRLHREAELFLGRADFARVQSKLGEAAARDRRAAELEAQVS